MERKLIVTVALAWAVLWAAPAGALTDAQRCEGAKLKASGKYGQCRLLAEAKAVRTGAPVDYSKCDLKYGIRWSRAETAYGGACPSFADQMAMQNFIVAHAGEVATSVATGSPLPDCPVDLATCTTAANSCNASLGACNAGYATCTGDLGACNGSLTTCTSDLGVANGSLTTCNGSLSTCSANLTSANGSLTACASDLGTANASLTTCNGSLSTCSANLTSANGSLTACASDLGTANASLTTCNGSLSTCSANLASANASLTTCTSDLGTANASLTTCTGNLGTATATVATCNAGTAGLGDVLSGKTFSSTAGIGATGTMANVGQQNVTPGASPATITKGYHDGTGTVSGDTDLVAANVVSGVDLFGVAGTARLAQRLRTGQTICYDGIGGVIACAGTGQDGELLKGLTRQYLDNGNGTVTDTKTDLTWEKLGQDTTTAHDKARMFTWDDAFKKVQVLNGNAAGCLASGDPDACCTGPGAGSCGAFAGQTDWRLPNRSELESLLSLGAVAPSVDATFDTACVPACAITACSCTEPNSYWSSTTYQTDSQSAWGIDFSDGSVIALYKGFGFFHVRAVRGGS